jgi:hypothetical protein
VKICIASFQPKEEDVNLLELRFFFKTFNSMHFVGSMFYLRCFLNGVGLGRAVRQVRPEGLARRYINLQILFNTVWFLFLPFAALLEMDSESLHSELPVKGDVSSAQVTLLSSLVQLITNVCCWPLPRKPVVIGQAQYTRMDLTHLTDDVDVRYLLALRWSIFTHAHIFVFECTSVL